MIVIDSSALLAIALRQPGWEPCFKALDGQSDLAISAVTLTETLIVASRRGVLEAMNAFLGTLALAVIPVDQAVARRAAAAYDRWGKGAHPAKLNLGDCFAYEVATAYDCPLLFVGNDFSQTDVKRAIQN